LAENDHDPGYVVHVDDVDPAPVRLADGWRDMDIRFVVTSDRSGSDEITFFRTVFPPGAAHERHLHTNADEFLYVISGSAAIGAGDREHPAPAGTVQYIPRGVVHWLRNLDPDEPVYLVGGYVGAGSLEASGYEFVSEITPEYRQVVTP